MHDMDTADCKSSEFIFGTFFLFLFFFFFFLPSRLFAVRLTKGCSKMECRMGRTLHSGELFQALL